MASEVKTGFEIAFYFLNKAEINSDHLQPQKLQRLLFLAQTYYIIGYDRALMPAVFVADERGPMEPNLFAAFSRGKPEIDVDTFLSDEIKNYLDAIWRRFGQINVEKLNNISKNSEAYQRALKRGIRSEITHDEMRESFNKTPNRSLGLSKDKQKLMRNQTGKTVKVTAWSPKKTL